MGRTKDLSGKIVTKVMQLALSMAAVVLMAGFFVIQTQAATAKVSASSVKIREQASTSSDMVGSADYGDSFLIQSEVTGSDGYVWYQVKFDGTKQGYIRSDLMEKSGEAGSGTETPSSPSVSTAGVTQVQPISANVTGDQVRVRPDASTNGSVVTTVAKDTTVKVNGMAAGADNRTWYMVSFQTGNGEVTGFIREDFLALAGEIVPMEVTPEVPAEPETPADVEVPEETVTPKGYETFEKDGVWYLVNNTSEPAYQYVIQDVFDAATTNADLYNDSLKTIKTQKVFIVILVLLLIGGAVAATFLIFKMKDMLDEAYFSEIEKETLNKRQNKQQNVMHTVGKDASQKKPTVNGQQRPAAKPQQPTGQPRQMPKQQPAAQPKPNMTAGSAQGQTKQPVQGKTIGQPATVSAQVKSQSQPMQGSTQVKPQSPQSVQTKPTQPSAQTKPTQPSAQTKPSVNAQQTGTKTNKDWKSKNFMADDDEFEFEFLNWDGEEEI